MLRKCFGSAQAKRKAAKKAEKERLQKEAEEREAEEKRAAMYPVSSLAALRRWLILLPRIRRLVH